MRPTTLAGEFSCAGGASARTHRVSAHFVANKIIVARFPDQLFAQESTPAFAPHHYPIMPYLKGFQHQSGENFVGGFFIFIPDLRGVSLALLLAVAKHYYRANLDWRKRLMQLSFP